MNKFTGILILLSILSGCAGNPAIVYRDVSYPPLNEMSTVYLGDRLIMQGKGIKADALVVNNLVGKYASISDATFCRAHPGSNQFLSFDRRAIRFINFIGGTRGYGNKVEYKESSNEICIDDFWSGCFDTSFGSYSYQDNAVCSEPNSIQQIIEYNGKAGNILNFTYREFIRNRMASAFTTNFTMDITEGDTINYKGAKLKVVKATNQEISYQVLKNFNRF